MRTMVFIINMLLSVLLLGLISSIYLPNSSAQNYSQMSLPKGTKARLGKGYIKDILYSPDGKVLAVVSSIGIWLYDTKIYKELNLLTIPMNKTRPLAHRITNAKFSVDGQNLLSVTEEKLILMWNISSGEHRVINMHSNVSFTNDGQTLTVDSENKTIELWHGRKEIIGKQEKKYLEIGIIMAYSPDGKTYATVEDEYTIRIRDTRTEKQTKFLIEFPEFVYDQRICLGPDGKTIATLHPNAPIRLWDVNIGKLKKTLFGYNVKYSYNRINTRSVSSTQVDSVEFSPDGKTLANGSFNGTIRIWNNLDGKLIKKLSGHYGFVKSLTYSPDGKILASGNDDGSILVWDVQTWEHDPFIAEGMISISCVSLSPDGKMLAGGSANGDIFLFDVETGNSITTLVGHNAEISHLLFSPDGKTIASSSWDGSTRLWYIETGKLLKTFSEPTSVHTRFYWRELLFNGNAELLIINSEFDFIHIWNVNTGQYKQTLMGHASHTFDIIASDDGKTLASNNADGTILIWDLTSITNVTNLNIMK